jgi:hypothetical protein
VPIRQDGNGAKTVEHQNTSANAAIPFPPPARSQIEPAQQPDQLPVVKLNAFIVVGGRQSLERPSLKALVENAEAVVIPEEDLEPIAVAIHEQE